MSEHTPSGRRLGGAVLGLSALAHDPAAALIVDGRLVAAVEQERIDRVKHSTAFPAGAICAVLAEGGLSLGDVDRIAYYWNDRGQAIPALYSACRHAPANVTGFARMIRQRLRGLAAPGMVADGLRPLLDGVRQPPVDFVDHHEAHLLAAWLSAPFEADAALVVDGRGEVHSTSLYDLRGGPDLPPRLVEAIPFPDSLGVFYGAVTQLLGYRALADEYKVMGLASYGQRRDRWVQRIESLMKTGPGGRPQVHVPSLRPENCSGSELPWLTPSARRRLTGRFRNADGSFTEDAYDFAYAAQEALERALLGLLRRLVARTGATKVVLVGGVAMNAAAVGRARAAGIVAELHVPLAPTDAGASVGAALATLNRIGLPVPSPEELNDPFLGPGFEPSELRAALVASKLPFRHVDGPAEAAAAIAAGRLVGWFDGRMEFGERALGARSILGDPRKPETRDLINASVKRRESYRPFAPSVLEEHSSRYFATEHSRRMGEIVAVTPQARAMVPAVVHVDGTARPQTVPKSWPAQRFRALIEHFDRLTGVPMVLNTSFNVRDEPIVCTPDDALRCFAVSGLDQLYLGDFVIDKGEFGA
ncbi:carbamoyltransferase C-terminal domain-containing protein [Nocardia sp. XZ_19_369]|uniref:carbamoyltransferase family protein n=1 Tax=Nocardia sp. XZ_19_369 TaxID=2769487 RepID=UPI00188E0136|nr:carbamoyltransferase C-terminal domain-containing protein [Nocardia sp. XZ_19_369]